MAPIEGQSQPRQIQAGFYALPDSNNTLTHPTNEEFQLQLGEGLYKLRDEILFGTIPPHPTDIPAPNQNVLDPKPLAPTAGPRLSLAVLAPRRSSPWTQRPMSGHSGRSSIGSRDAENPFESSHSSSDHTGSGSGGFKPICKFGEGNPALVPAPTKDTKDPMKRKKPKRNVTKSGSSFLSRAVLPDGINKRLQERKADGLLAVANISRAILWLDLSASNKQEQLAKLLFMKAQALCHHCNVFTKTPAHLDTIIGFSTADIMWYEPISQKYSRLNKNGVVHPFPVTCIRWLPGSENLFIAAHLDGTLVVYDKEKEDGAFTVEDFEDENAASNHEKNVPRVIVKKSVQSKTQKHNPVSFWKVTNNRINGMEFSPDGQLLAIASEDGSLRVIDYLNERLLDLYSSYFGGLTCLCWSPDGQFIAAGGQDDLISVISIEDRAMVARCVGHRSWVSDIAFDPWKSDERTYRIGSVGDDCRLLLWDFSVGMLNRPRRASIRQSISPYEGGPVDGPRGSVATVRRISDVEGKPNGSEDVDDIRHPIQARSQLPMIPPVLSKEVDSHPLTWLGFEEDCIIAACKSGHVLTWERPLGDGHKGAGPASSDFRNPFR